MVHLRYTSIPCQYNSNIPAAKPQPMVASLDHFFSTGRGDLAIVDTSEEVVAGGSFISYMLFLTKT
jgi:hypothetical protein